MIVWVAVVLLPQASTAVNVRITRAKSLALASVSSLWSTVTLLQLSLASAAEAGRSSYTPTVRSAGTLVKTGATVSMTVMVCTYWLLLPQGSTAVNVRRMVALPAHSPSRVSSEEDTVTLPQSSWATTAEVGTTASQEMVVSAGTWANEGAAASTMVMIWMSMASLPQSSATRQVRAIFSPMHGSMLNMVASLKLMV